MTQYALVLDGEVTEVRDYPTLPDCKKVDDLPVLRPLVETVKPSYNLLTQTLVASNVIFSDRVEVVWTIVSLPQEQADVNIENDAKAKLNDIDLKSIRSIREYIASKPDAPQFIKDYEVQANAERSRIPTKP